MTMCRRFLIPLLLLSVTSAVVEVEGAQVILYTNDLLMTGLELARVPRVPGTRRNSEHRLWHPRISRFLIVTGTRKAHSM